MNRFDHELDSELAARWTLDERGGPAARLSRERAHALVDQALDDALQASTGGPASVGSASRTRSRNLVWLASAAAVLLLLGGSAFAALRYFAAPAQSAPKAARANGVRAAVPPPSVVTTAAEPALAPPEVQPQPEMEPTQVRRESSRAERAEPAPRAEPEDLLQAANHLRAQGRFDAAADVYALVYERYPGSISAYTAQVARAALELEHRENPRLARTLFTRALRGQPHGALDIEVRQGLALALHDLGETAAEAQVLHDLIKSHAGSPAAKRARARLHELDMRAR